jgi:hypothetical protein
VHQLLGDTGKWEEALRQVYSGFEVRRDLLKALFGSADRAFGRDKKREQKRPEFVRHDIHVEMTKGSWK